MPPKSRQEPERGKSAITSFFKPASRPQSQTPVAASPTPSSQPPSQPSSQSQSQAHSPALPPLPNPESVPAQTPKTSRVSQLASSSPALRSPSPLPPSSPVVKPPAQRPKNAIIAASDDEDGGDDESDSDDNMVDLMAVFGSKRDDPSKPPIDASLFETPKAKRIMSKHVHSSPLTIQFKNERHDFDMKALLKDAEQEKATKESYLLNQQEAAAHAEAQAAETQADKDAAVLGVIAQAGGDNVHKVLRTMRRGQTAFGAPRYCFFETRATSKKTPAMPSRKAATGPWRLLIQGPISKREQYLVSGMPYTILQKMGGLPEELFDWILKDLCVTESMLMQIEYAKLIALCPQHIHERITPDLLGDLFALLGAAANQEQEDGTLSISRPREDPYPDGDWSSLRAFLKLLAETAESMSTTSLTSAALTLLRMGMDKFVLSTMDVLMEYEGAISALCKAFPVAGWESFCAEASQHLHANFKLQSIRINTLLCLPISTERTHELRRRLATVFMFEDPSLGAQHPDKTITIRRVIEHVRSKAFDITKDTEFNELSARLLMLDTAVNDGGWDPTSGSKAEEQFNKDVDELADALRAVYRRINDTGGKAGQSNVKGVFEWVEKRMSYQVRAKPKPKRNIFDTIMKDKEEVNIPQQRDFIRSFLGKPVGGGGSRTPNDA